MNFTIKNHLLFCDGKQVPFRRSPNVGGAIAPQILVMHYTGADNAAGSVAWLCDPASKVSAHLVLAQDGGVTQLAPFNVMTWHAGKSKWGARTNLNGCAIGIEMANCGLLKKMADGTFRAELAKKSFKASEVVIAAHRNTLGQVEAWDDYPAAQIAAAGDIMKAIAEAYGIKPGNIVGHEDIAPGRKMDPGPAFPLARLVARAFGRQ